MQKVNAIEPQELIGRLERKFERKVKSQIGRRQEKYLKRQLNNFHDIKWSLIYDDTDPVMGR